MAHEAGGLCPYCGRQLRWIPMRWFGRGTFECERCGEFPDFGPSAHAGAHLDRAPARSVHDTPPAFAIPRAADLSRPRVLMIDDSNEERDLYALMLEGDMTVLTASRGAEGLARASSDLPDAIVLDVMMPGMDGWEVCRRLKANPDTAEIPIIMLTAQDEPTLADEASRNGATALLTKPCPIEKLTHVITTAIGR